MVKLINVLLKIIIITIIANYTIIYYWEMNFLHLIGIIIIIIIISQILSYPNEPNINGCLWLCINLNKKNLPMWLVLWSRSPITNQENVNPLAKLPHLVSWFIIGW